MPAADLRILVFGHTRPRALRYVLEGLRRQGALPATEVWLDGHQERAELISRVTASQALAQDFPEATWINYGTRRGLAALLIAALERASASHDKVLILEDDCYPAENAVEVFRRELGAVAADPSVFSVYGHHFADPFEGDRTTAFQGWGWATTRGKLKPILSELKRLYQMTEPDCIRWLADHMTDQVRARMDRYPERASSQTLGWRFCWDAIVAFLVAQRTLVNQRTPEQVVFNFGIGLDAGHFGSPNERFLRPPYNMITEAELVERFQLRALERHESYRIAWGTPYTFALGSADRRLLGTGWSIGEHWGTWSEGDRSCLLLRSEEPARKPVTLSVLVRPFVYSGKPLIADVWANQHSLARWQFHEAKQSEFREVTIPAAVWNREPITTVEFQYTGAQSPAAVSSSPDIRRLALGLAVLQLTA